MYHSSLKYYVLISFRSKIIINNRNNNKKISIIYSTCIQYHSSFLYSCSCLGIISRWLQVTCCFFKTITSNDKNVQLSSMSHASTHGAIIQGEVAQWDTEEINLWGNTEAASKIHYTQILLIKSGTKAAAKLRVNGGRSMCLEPWSQSHRTFVGRAEKVI